MYVMFYEYDVNNGDDNDLMMIPQLIVPINAAAILVKSAHTTCVTVSVAVLILHLHRILSLERPPIVIKL